MAPSAFPTAPGPEKDQSWWGETCACELENCFPSYSRKDVSCLGWHWKYKKAAQMKICAMTRKESRDGAETSTRVKLKASKAPSQIWSFLMANSKSAARARTPFLRCARRNQAQCGGAARGLLVLRGGYGPVRWAGSYYAAEARLVVGTWPRHWLLLNQGQASLLCPSPWVL